MRHEVEDYGGRLVLVIIGMADSLLFCLRHAVGQSPRLRCPRVTPFPAGLTGTLVFHSDLRAPDNPDGRNHLFTIDLATRKVTQLTSGGIITISIPNGRLTDGASRSCRRAAAASIST